MMYGPTTGVNGSTGAFRFRGFPRSDIARVTRGPAAVDLDKEEKGALLAATIKSGLSPPPTPAGGPVAEPEISSFGEGLPAPPIG